MKNDKTSDSSYSNTEKTLSNLSKDKKAPKFVFVLLLLLYIGANILVNITSRSDEVILILGRPTPLRSLTGVFSSLDNICIIFLVILFDKWGYIVALVLLLAQFPTLIGGMISGRNISSISGFFTNLLAVIAITIIHNNNVNIKKYQVRLRDQAVTDRLTGLPNRFAGMELMNDLVSRRETFVLAVMNLNNFKNINNAMGQSTGNDILVEIGRRWKEIADQDNSEAHDFITYQGADEYAVIIRDFNFNSDILDRLSKYREAIKKITIDEVDYYMTASIGYAEYPADAGNSDDLLACAYSALMEAKRLNSDNHICRFTPELLNSEHIIETESKIRQAIEDKRLFFYLQPQFDISRRLRGFEALARMKDAEGNIISPGEFIPVAEKVGLIDTIDYIVFRDAAIFFGQLIRQTRTDIVLSSNISVKHLMKNDFLDEIKEILAISGVPANQLEIEITESIMIDSIDKALQCINEIKKMGIKIAIDDFGTGYSSLSYLNNFPVDILKVDKSFIDKMNSGETFRKYVEAIISIGHVMNFDVISEGVETPDQLETLRKIGCDYIQGFIWGRPMDPESAKELLLKSV